MTTKKDQFIKLWEYCKTLNKGKGVSDFKDHMLTLLFIKYATQSSSNNVHLPYTYSDVELLKSSDKVREDLNKLIKEVSLANGGVDMMDSVDFTILSEEDVIGMIDVFSNIDIDVKHRDVLGDTYEFLVKNYARIDGKAHGEYYTPPQMSMLLSRLLGITPENTAGKTAYDPTCGSGSLLMKLHDMSEGNLSLFGQELSSTTSSLATMNLKLKGGAKFSIKTGNTMTDPKFLNEDGSLQQFDYIVANPPYSTKNWSDGGGEALTIEGTEITDKYDRFMFGQPSAKQGDYAFIQHIIASLKDGGKACIILPHGVLFRSNVERDIRRGLAQSGYLKAIIGLPSKVFYGTAIPTCVMVIEKTKGVPEEDYIDFVDGSRWFEKDGSKNIIRESDVLRIMHALEDPNGYNNLATRQFVRHLVALDRDNVFNLNISRRVDYRQVEEDKQDRMYVPSLKGLMKGKVPAGFKFKYGKYFTETNLFDDLFKAVPEDRTLVQLRNSLLTLGDDISRSVDSLEIPKHLVKLSVVAGSQSLRAVVEANINGSLDSLVSAVASHVVEFFEDTIPLINGYTLYQSVWDAWNNQVKDLVLQSRENLKPLDTIFVAETFKAYIKEGVNREIRRFKGEATETLTKVLTPFNDSVDDLITNLSDDLNKSMDDLVIELNKIAERHEDEKSAKKT